MITKYNSFVNSLLETNTSGIWYHGSNNKFEKFDLIDNKTYKEFDVPSWFFTKDIKYAKTFGKYLYSVKLHLTNTFVTTKPKHLKIFLNQLKEWDYSNDKINNILDEEFYNQLPYWTCGDAFYIAKMNGFDSIMIQEELESEVISIAVFDKDNIEIINMKEIYDN